jgi:hypothetical protein
LALFVQGGDDSPHLGRFKTDPPIDFTPTFKTVEEDGMRVDSWQNLTQGLRGFRIVDS